MATPNDRGTNPFAFDVRMLSDAERQRDDRYQQAISIVEDFIAGRRADLPLGDPLIQGAVRFLLRDLARFRRDSEKLDVIKEVFGGGK